MTTITTIQDLPDDMLHEIFGHVFGDEPEETKVFATQPAVGNHAALRCVCRRWRDIADWVRLYTSHIYVDTSELAAPGAVRARHLAACKSLVLTCPQGSHHTTIVSRTAASLINGSADLRRALSRLQLQTCCLPSLVPAVTTIASCTALTELCLFWGAHKNERVVPSDMLAPLSALRMLGTLEYGHAFRLPTSAVLTPLPALPDAPRLTHLDVRGSFVPVGSDAALGRLRKLYFEHMAPVQELVDAEDPFLLRAAFDAGTWQPSRLTGLQELAYTFHTVRDSLAPVRPSRTGSRSGSEWAPLAGQVTALMLQVKSDSYKRSSTGIFAGLGVLTALRELRVKADWPLIRGQSFELDKLQLLSLDRVRAPHLTLLETNCISTPANVARFPNLGDLKLMSLSRQPPLNLRSLVARSCLKTLNLIIPDLPAPGSINLAELFVGGAGWPVLENLLLLNIVLEWDAADLAGAPTAAEFAGRARQLLPALVDVTIYEPVGRGMLPDWSRVGFVVACRRHVVPALLGLRAGRR